LQSLCGNKFPIGNDKSMISRRKELFKDLDPNGNGILSLAEIDKGMRDVFKLMGVFNCKPALLRSFNIAKDISIEKKKKSRPSKQHKLFNPFD